MTPSEKSKQFFAISTAKWKKRDHRPFMKQVEPGVWIY